MATDPLPPRASMTKRTSTPMPGNDGTWFLDLVTASHDRGPSAARPEPVMAYSGAAADFQAPPPAAVATVAAPPPPLPPATTHETVERMWTDATVQPIPAGVPVRASTPFEAWVPEEMSKTVMSRRNFRWPIIVIALLAGALVATTIVALPLVGSRAADARSEEYRGALSAIRDRLPDVQATLAAVTDVSTGMTGLSGSAIAGLAGAADDAGVLAALPLPSTFPLVPRASVEALQPHRELTGLAASDAAALADRLQKVFRYRSTTEHLLDLPPLPTGADSATINELSVTLASTLADATGALSEVSADGALGEHRARLGEVIARLGDWQVEYLDALRREDADRAGDLIEETRTWSRQLESALLAGLGAVREEVDRDLVRLSQDIDDLLVSLPD